MARRLTLVSHHLCPYVQRAVIVAAEKGIPYERVSVDLSAKPDWFVRLSPTGKVPLLRVEQDGVEQVLFESAPIAEFLDETGPGRLLPEDPVARAQARAYVEFASATLNDIWGFYVAPDAEAFDAKRDAVRARFAQMEQAVAGPWFGGDRFGLVDAAWGPVFRYLDAFEGLAGVFLAQGLPVVGGWRERLATRPSVAGAVAADYPERLAAFLRARGSHLSRLIVAREAVAA